MKVLLDTNIVINREASTIRHKEIGSLFAWFDKLHYEKCVHPLTVEEIENHEDPQVISTFKVKIKNYVSLNTEAPLATSVSKLSQQMDKSQNDINDTRLLNEVVNNRVDFLITEDKRIHEKARLLNIANQVFTIESFLEKVTAENPSLLDYKTLSVKKEYFGNINLKDSFFDSFRNDYQGFDVWFNKKSNEPAYVCLESKQTLAFLYVKIENKDEDYSDINPIFSKKKRLKIGTFKVNLNGYKLGERFIKIVFDNALKQQVDEIYVTIFNRRPEEDRLINLLLEWGFTYWGIKKSSSGEEQVYVRNFTKSFNTINPKLTYPYVSSKSDVYMVSIYEAYHTNLFPDSILNTESPDDFVENVPFRNAISKVYVSRSLVRNLKSGDIVVFYRTGGYHKSVVTTIGIVENVVINIKDEQQFLELCRKRSVFSNDELTQQWRYSSNKPFVVNFLYAYSFPHRINMAKLMELGIIHSIDGAPRGFTKISSQDFEKIVINTGTDRNLIG